MQIRHATLGLALAVAGLAAGGARVLADEGEHREELHLVRGATHVVIDRTDTLHRLDDLLEGVDAVDALTTAPPGRAVGRTLRDGGGEDPRGDGADDRERPGAQPVERGSLRHIPPPVAGRLVEERLDAMRREIIELRRRVLRAPEVVVPRRPVLLPMDDRAFGLFVRSVARAPFARDKVAVVEDAARHAYFTSGQAAIVVRAIEAWGQLDAALALHPRVLDPESFHLVVDAVTFRSDRDELRRRIRY